MNPVSFRLALVVLTLGTGPALAQSSPPAQGFLTERPAGSLRATKLVGVDVIGMDHRHIGHTEEVVIDASGRVQAVVIGVGGFLGIGEKRVAVPFDQIAWNWDDRSESAGQATSSTTSANAPSAESAATSGPSTLPGAQISNDVLSSVDEKRGGEVNDATGSVLAADQSRGRATVPVAGSRDGPHRAEVRLTKAMLQAAPAYQP